MREPAPDYASRQYDRPNQPWVCGLSCEGRACPAGPTERGECPALAECVPARDGDRWKCNRSAFRGGECAEGPTPEGACGCVHRCRPVRSLRAVRGRFVTACALSVLGCLLILFNGRWRDDAISPGPLTGAHAQLLADESSLHKAGTCVACHAAGERSVSGWAVSLVGFHSAAASQSTRCMECHKTTIPIEHALAAHSVDPSLLREITGPGNRSAADGEYACATCHREHQGSQFDIAAMNDGSCQSCHQARYGSFATDHPEFGNWPYERRTRIVFNHASHRAKHFADKKQAFECRTCHLEDATHSVQLTASYDEACASCHDEKIATSVAKGVPMLVLPTLDVEALKAAGYDVGPWPEGAIGDFDGRLPAVMKLLLAADPAAKEATAALGAEFDFIDVDPDDSNQLAACAAIAKAIRALFEDVIRRGPAAFRERLRESLGLNASDSVAGQLVAGLSGETIRGAGDWLGIDSGNEAWPMEAGVKSGRSVTSPHFDPAGTWSIDEATFAVRYQPAAHADPVLASWLQLLVTVPELESRPIELAMFKEMSSATAAGHCASCHSIERGAGGQMAINWRAFDGTSDTRRLTKFSHGPHVMLPQLADCTSCHSINDAADTSKSYAPYDPHAFVSDFAPVSKQHCAQCHTARAAGDSCQKCHNYHVDVVEAWRKGSRRGAEVAEFRNTNPR